MAVFNITGPDGKKYRVTGETAEGAVAALKTMLGQTGVSQEQKDRIAAAKAGTLAVDPERLARAEALNAQGMKDVAASAYEPGRLASFVTGAAQGGTFGFSDEILAGLHALSPNDTYDEALSRTRGILDASRRDHPVYSYGGEVLGAAASGGTATAPITRGAAGLGSAVGRGMAAGALEGAAYGAGTGEGGVAPRARNAVRGAAFGAGAGFVAPLAVAGVGKAVNAIKNPVSSALNIASPTRASRAIEEAIRRSGKSADEVSDAIAAAAREGQPMYGIADELGPAGQRMLSGSARVPGAARQKIADMLVSRQSGQGNRLSSFVADALDASDTAAARRSGMEAARKATADAAYDAARNGAGPVDVRGALSVIDDRIGPMQGSGVAGDGIDGILSRFRNRLAARNPDASSIPGSTGVSAGGAEKTAVDLSDFSRVLGVKQDVDDAIGAAVRAGRNNEARELGKLKSALDQALEGASAGYRTANDNFARASREIGKIDAGSAATSGRVRADDTVGRYGAMTGGEQSAFRAGYADPLIARIDSAAPGVNKARPLLSDKSAAELGAMANDPGMLARRIGRENTMFETTNAALGGSRTADNLQDIADVSGLSGSMLINLLTGNWKAAATQAGDKAISAATGRSDATRELIAKMLLSGDVQGALAPALSAAKTTAERSRIAEAVLRAMGVRSGETLTLPSR